MRKKRDVVADRETRSIVVTKWPATDGLVPPYLMEQISDICSSNADIVNEYLQEMDHEGLVRGYRSNACLWIARMAEYCHKPYKKMRANIFVIFGHLPAF